MKGVIDSEEKKTGETKVTQMKLVARKGCKRESSPSLKARTINTVAKMYNEIPIANGAYGIARD